jgi:prepilin peptidase CpaA
MSLRFAVAILVGVVAVAEDLLRRRISNWIPITAFVAGVGLLAFDRGWRGALSALGGALGGFLVFLVFYLLGGMGGGDVKLMAGLGALLGAENVLAAALWTAACGGMLAMFCLAVSALRRLWTKPSGESGAVRTIPYAPAIAVGSWLALLPKS